MEYSQIDRHVLGQRDKDQGLGGFPGPFQLGRRLARRYFPEAYKRMMLLGRADDPARKQKLKWLTDSLKDLAIGRNSEFNTEELNDDQLEELGGIECVRVLCTCPSCTHVDAWVDIERCACSATSSFWCVMQTIFAALFMTLLLQYFIGTQLISFILIAPWLSTTHTYDDVFSSQPRLVNKSWYVYALAM